jgi:hypothetical protein
MGGRTSSRSNAQDLENAKGRLQPRAELLKKKFLNDQAFKNPPPQFQRLIEAFDSGQRAYAMAARNAGKEGDDDVFVSLIHLSKLVREGDLQRARYLADAVLRL